MHFLRQKFQQITVSDRLKQRCAKSIFRKIGLAPKKPTEAFYFHWTKRIKQTGVKLRNINATSIKFPDNSFDYIIALSVN